MHRNVGFNIINPFKNVYHNTSESYKVSLFKLVKRKQMSFTLELYCYSVYKGIPPCGIRV